MAIVVNQAGFELAKRLIVEGKVDVARDWTSAAPTPASEDAYLSDHSIGEYGDWFLALNTEHDADAKAHYEFPYGDFNRVHRSGVVAAKQRAGQYHHAEIESAATELLNLIDNR